MKTRQKNKKEMKEKKRGKVIKKIKKESKPFKKEEKSKIEKKVKSHHQKIIPISKNQEMQKIKAKMSNTYEEDEKDDIKIKDKKSLKKEKPSLGKKKEKNKDEKSHTMKEVESKELNSHNPEDKEYTITVDNAKVKIKIETEEKGYKYILEIPEIETGTEALLSHIRKELTSVTAIAVGEIVDQKSINEIKNRFMKDARTLIEKSLPIIEKNTEDFLIGLLMQEMLGLGKIEFLINDPSLEEIVIISSKEPTRVFHKKFGWLSTNITPKTEDEILNYSNIIARRIGRQISILTPLLDAHVITGDRANAVLYPISTKGHTITIRKFSRDPWTIIDLIDNNTVSLDIAAILWLAFEFEMNVLISGGTGSGKTVFLNACMPFIPPNHRIISMEDTRELTLPKFLYWCPLVTRSANAEGKGEVSMLDLLINSLRMRPDRIVLGEIRRQREAEVLFEAMHTGHSVYATVHADTANETIRRLTNPPINIPATMLGSVNLNLVMFRDRKRGFRRAFQLAEFMSGKDNVSANVIHRWIPETDKFTEHNKSQSFTDSLSRHTGMSQNEIKVNIDEKKAILEWLIKNKIRDLESIGRVMNIYFTDKESLDDIIKHNKIEKIVIKPRIKKAGEV